MSVSPAVNVLRWSALGLGIFYGISHQASISAKDKLAAVNAEYKHKEDLIRKAKAEYAAKNAPKSASAGVISDPSDPKFDLEALLKQAEKA